MSLAREGEVDQISDLARLPRSTKTWQEYGRETVIDVVLI